MPGRQPVAPQIRDNLKRIRLVLDVAVASTVGSGLATSGTGLCESIQDTSAQQVLIALPASFRNAFVSDFAQYLSKQLATPLARLTLSVDHCVFHQKQHLRDVLREGDILTVHVEGGAAVSRAIEQARTGASDLQTVTKRARLEVAARGGNGSAPLALVDASPAARRRLDLDTSVSRAPLAASPVQRDHCTKRRNIGDAAKVASSAALLTAKDRMDTVDTATTKLAKPTPAPGLPSRLPGLRSTGASNEGSEAAVPPRREGSSAVTIEKELPQKGPATFTHPLLGYIDVMDGDDVHAFVQRKLRTLRKAVRRQFDHYFSESNWKSDMHLQEQVDCQGFVRLSHVAEFDRLHALTSDIDFMRECMRDSEVVQVSPCGSLVRPRWRA